MWIWWYLVESWWNLWKVGEKWMKFVKSWWGWSSWWKVGQKLVVKINSPTSPAQGHEKCLKPKTDHKHLLVDFFWLQILLVSLSWKVGEKLVKLVESWWKVGGELVKSRWIWWKVGEIGGKLVNSWWKVGERSTVGQTWVKWVKLVKFVKLVKNRLNMGLLFGQFGHVAFWFVNRGDETVKWESCLITHDTTSTPNTSV